jgi:hypothetical protein
MMKPCNIVARDLNDLYYQVLNTIYIDEFERRMLRWEHSSQYTYKQKIDKGSFEDGGERIQFESLSLCVEHPETRPLAPIFPQGVMPTTSDDNIEKYFATYIMNETPDAKSKEDYIYGTFIYPHCNHIINLLSSTPNTNQAVINIGEPFQYEVVSPERLAALEAVARAAKDHCEDCHRRGHDWPEFLWGCDRCKMGAALAALEKLDKRL